MANELALVLGRRRSVVDQKGLHFTSTPRQGKRTADAKAGEHRRWSCPLPDTETPETSCERNESEKTTIRSKTSSEQNQEKTFTTEDCDEKRLKALCAKYLHDDAKTECNAQIATPHAEGKVVGALSGTNFDTYAQAVPSVVRERSSEKMCNEKKLLEASSTGQSTHSAALQTNDHVISVDSACSESKANMVKAGLCEDAQRFKAHESLGSITSEKDVVATELVKFGKHIVTEAGESLTGDVLGHQSLQVGAIQTLIVKIEDLERTGKSATAEDEGISSILDSSRAIRDVSFKNALDCSTKKPVFEREARSDSGSRDAIANKPVGRLDKTRFTAWEKSDTASKNDERGEGHTYSAGVQAVSTDQTSSVRTEFCAKTYSVHSGSKDIVYHSEAPSLGQGSSPTTNELAEQGCNIIDLSLLADASAASPIPSLFNKPGADELKLSISCIEATVETRCAHRAFVAWLRHARLRGCGDVSGKALLQSETRAAKNTAGARVIRTSDASMLSNQEDDPRKCEMDLVAEIQDLQAVLKKKTALVESMRQSAGSAFAASGLFDIFEDNERKTVSRFTESQDNEVELAKLREDCRRLANEAEKSKRELAELRSNLIAKSSNSSSVQSFDISSPVVAQGFRAGSLNGSPAGSLNCVPLSIDITSTAHTDVLRNSCLLTNRSCEGSIDASASQMSSSSAHQLHVNLKSTEFRCTSSCGSTLDTARSFTSTPRKTSTPSLHARGIAVPVEVVPRKTQSSVQSCSRRSMPGACRLGDNRVAAPRNVVPAATPSRHARYAGSHISSFRSMAAKASVISRVPVVKVS